MSKFINLIVCHSSNKGIGLNNKIPWLLKSDLTHFKKITCSTDLPEEKNAVIMGKNTWLSLPSKSTPLKDRYNVVLTSKKNKFDNYDKCDYITNSIDDSINHLTEKENIKNIFVIGGERVYKDVLKSYTELVDKLYITELYQNIKCDSYFPDFDEDLFKLIKLSNFKEENNQHFRYLVYQNKNNISEISENISIDKTLNNQIAYNTKPGDCDKYLSNTWRNNEELQYYHLLNNILENGIEKTDRTKVGTYNLFAPKNLHFDLSDTFPIQTYKRGFLKGIFEELMFLLRGQTDNSILNSKGVNVWDGNTTREFLDKQDLVHLPENDLGATYGFNLRYFGAKYHNCKTDYSIKKPGFDQLEYAINLIKNEPDSRRIIIDLWNPNTLKISSLPPCLMYYQFNVDTKNKKLNLFMMNRSSDLYLAGNWNTVSGAILVNLICNLEDIDLTPGYLVHQYNETHIYKNQLNAVKTMLKKEPKPYPKLLVKTKKKKITDFEYSDLKLIGYKYHEQDDNLKVPMAV